MYIGFILYTVVKNFAVVSLAHFLLCAPSSGAAHNKPCFFKSANAL